MADLQEVFIAEVVERVGLEGVVETNCHDLGVRVDVVDGSDDRVPVVEEHGSSGEETFQISGGCGGSVAECTGDEGDGSGCLSVLAVRVHGQDLCFQIVVEAVVFNDVKGTDQTVQRDVVGSAGDGDEFRILDVLDCFCMQVLVPVRICDAEDLGRVLIAFEGRIEDGADLAGPDARKSQVIVAGFFQFLVRFWAVVLLLDTDCFTDEVRIRVVDPVSDATGHLADRFDLINAIVPFRYVDHSLKDIVVDDSAVGKIFVPVGGLLDAHAGGDGVAEDGVALELRCLCGRADRERSTDGGYHAEAHQKRKQFVC